MLPAARHGRMAGLNAASSGSATYNVNAISDNNAPGNRVLPSCRDW